jgi:hypothetical protein
MGFLPLTLSRLFVAERTRSGIADPKDISVNLMLFLN